MKRLQIVLTLFVVVVTALKDPIARLPNGSTIVGRHIPNFKQDVFLGIPYASKPVRFTPSKLLNLPANTKVVAKSYGVQCPSYGSDTKLLLEQGLMTMGEDCLNLNIVRPAGKQAGLPVLLWIYGGGWQQGATADPRYNLSYIVQQSALMGKPVLGVSINYRTAGFGFLFSQEVQNSGNANLGLRDQRTALQWIQRNIAFFGGDPRKVTLWGESAGAYSVGHHLLAHGGRNDHLFRAAILESGSAVGPPLNDTRWYQPLYDRVTVATGCSDAIDTLDCLRRLPYSQLYPALDVGREWFAVFDGSFVTSWPSLATRLHRFVKVPLLLGSNTDEGTSFGVTGVNTDTEAVAQLTSSKRWVLTAAQASALLELYPNDPALGSPYGTGNRTFPALGVQYKRYSSIAGDLTMDAPRRLLAEEATEAGVKVFSYRFDQAPQNSTEKVGVGHFAEVPYVFANTEQQITPLGTAEEDLRLARLMARMWCAFAAEGDPNSHGVGEVVRWPEYRNGKQNMVLRANKSYVERDTYREKEMAFINTLLR